MNIRRRKCRISGGDFAVKFGTSQMRFANRPVSYCGSVTGKTFFTAETTPTSQCTSKRNKFVVSRKTNRRRGKHRTTRGRTLGNKTVGIYRVNNTVK